MKDITIANEPRPQNPWARWARRLLLLSSGLACVALMICYGARPDVAAAITVFPVWIWVVPGLLLIILGKSGENRRIVALLAAVWLVFVLILAEEPRSLARALTPLPAMSDGGFPVRVVTLNCNVGDARAADEVVALGPDLVLLQESPSRDEVEALARRLYGPNAGFVHGVDASLMARGPVVAESIPGNTRGACVQARVTLPGGCEITVLSVRLIPAVFRLDLWSPDCWSEQAENRRLRREQLRAISAKVKTSSTPVILGGDFNAPQGDAVFEVLRPGLDDAFRHAGRGWGDTITNGFPALRIDQVWVSREFLPRSVVARSSRHSDHRVVVCDLSLRRSE